jgi:LIVCS family branched-chain amino acid:cation transporter
MIVLILLGFLSKVIHCSQGMYVGAVLLTSIIGLNDAVKAINPHFDFLSWLALPLSNLGFSWVVPAVLGGMLGFLYSKWNQRKTPVYQQAKQSINN